MALATIRMRTGDLVTPSNIVMYPALSLAGVVRGSGSQVLPGAVCKLYVTTSDIRIDTQTSDALGRYAFPVSDRLGYYVVGVYNTTYHADLTTVTADQALTADDTQVDGVTLNSLVGA